MTLADAVHCMNIVSYRPIIFALQYLSHIRWLQLRDKQMLNVYFKIWRCKCSNLVCRCILFGVVPVISWLKPQCKWTRTRDLLLIILKLIKPFATQTDTLQTDRPTVSLSLAIPALLGLRQSAHRMSKIYCRDVDVRHRSSPDTPLPAA